MAKIIGSAGIRLTAESKGLASEFKLLIGSAIKEATAGLGDGSTDGVVKDAEKNSNKLKGIFGGILSTMTNVGKQASTNVAGGILKAVTTGGQLALIGAKAGIALAGVSSLVTGVVGLVGVLAQASGAAAVLPAAFIAIKVVSGTLKVALDGVSESFSALASGDAKAFQESLKGLAPAARSFVTEIAAVKPAFDKIKLGTQQALFAGLGESVKPLAQRYLPIVNDFMTQIGRSANTGAKSLLEFANNGETAGQVSLFAGKINIAFQQLMPSLVNVASALLDVGQVGSDFLPGMAEGFSNVTEKVAGFIRESAASGQLSAFIQNAIDTLKQLGQVLVQFGGGFAAVFKAAQQAGGGFLNGLLEIGTAFNRFVSSSEGQAALVSFFTAMRAIIAAVLPVVTALAGVIGRDLAPILGNLAATIGPAFLPVVEALGGALKAAAPGIAIFAKGFADILVAAAPLIRVLGQVVGLVAGALGGALSAIAPAIGSMAGVLADAMPAFADLAKGMGDIIKAAAPLFPIIAQLAGIFAGALGQALQAVAPVLTQMAQELAKGLVTIMPKLTPIITAVATTLGQLFAALVPLIPAFLQILEAILPILPPLLQLVAAILPALVQLVQAVTPIIVALASVFADLIPIFTEVVQVIIGILLPPIQLIATVVANVAQIVASVFNGLAGFIKNIFSLIGSIISGVWGAIVNTITGAVDSVGQFIRGGFQGIRDFFGTIMGNIGKAVSDGIADVVTFFTNLPGKILRALGDFATLLYEAGRDLLKGLLEGIKSMVTNLIHAVTNFAHDMVQAMFEALGIRSPSTVFRGIGVNMVKGLIGGIEGMTSQAVAAVTDLAKSTASAFDPLALNVPVPNVVGGDGAALGALGAGGLILQQTNIMQPGADVTQFAGEVWKRGASDLASGNSTLNVGRQSVQAGMAAPGSVVDLGA